MLIPTDELGPAELNRSMDRRRDPAHEIADRHWFATVNSVSSAQLSPWLGRLCRAAAACGLVSRLGRSLGGGCVSWWQSAWMTAGSNWLPALRWSSAIASGVVRAVW